MEIRTNHNNPSFGAIRGNAKDIVGRLRNRSVELVLEQVRNNVADIIFSDSAVKVVARKGHTLPYGLGENGIREFSPNFRNRIDYTTYKAENGYVFNVGQLSPDYYTLKSTEDIGFEVCREIATKAYHEAAMNGKTGSYNLETTEKIVGALLDLDL